MTPATRATALSAAALAVLAAAGAAQGPADVFAGLPKDKACVAWKARKRIWLLWHEDEVGVSCAVKVRAVDEEGGRRVRASFPIVSLHSGEPIRDYRVQECLGAVRVPDIEFVSRPYAPADWSALRGGKITELEGRLRISGVYFPLRLPFALVGAGAEAAAQGAVLTSLKAFDIPAPVGGSPFLMQVQDAVELDYRVPLSSLASQD